jgi:GT2 family glycosyltransferase
MSSATAVIILNWNGVEQLRSFLPSVVEHTRDVDIIVADNASTDNSVTWLKQNYPEIKVIELSINHGYAGGYNEAIKQVEHDYLVLLNSDVEVTKNWLNPLIELIKKDLTIAVCQPKIRSQRQKDLFEYAGAAGGFIDKYGIPYCRGRIFTNVEKDTNQYNDDAELFWASGACLVIRNTVFKQANGFDSDFFAHMEEIDLCWRIHRMGYKISYCPGSTVYHVGAATLKKESPKKTYLNFRNSLWMLHKNLPANILFPILFARLCMDGAAGVHYLVKGKWKHTIAIIQAHAAFYFKGDKTNKRNALKQYPDYYKNQNTILNRSIIIEFYFKGKKIFSRI